MGWLKTWLLYHGVHQWCTLWSTPKNFTDQSKNGKYYPDLVNVGRIRY